MYIIKKWYKKTFEMKREKFKKVQAKRNRELERERKK
jgi:hypothetical protein